MKINIFFRVSAIRFFKKFPNLISDKNHAKLLFICVFGKMPNLDNPKTFNEHINSLKIKDEKLDYWRYTDKYEVRNYVRDTVGEEFLNEVYGIYESFDNIDFDRLPDKFALKGTHGSSYNIIVPDKTKLDKKNAKKKFDKWLSENYYLNNREKNYKNIKPRIMADRYLLSVNKEFLDEYKLFCCNGKVKFITHNVEKPGKRYTNVYDEKWNLVPVRYGYPTIDGDVLPENKNKLIEIAEKLSKPFEFVRVDLYDIDEKIIFSELTFHPGGGNMPFKPKKYDMEFGKFFEKDI